MLNSASGLDLQAVIAGHLRSMGFQIMETAELDHEAKLDWVITKLPAWPRIIALGVQITARRGDLGKQGEFLARNRATNGNLPPVDRALYGEYDDRVHVGRWSPMRSLATCSTCNTAPKPSMVSPSRARTIR